MSCSAKLDQATRYQKRQTIKRGDFEYFFIGSARYGGLNNTDMTTVYVQLYWPINPMRGSVQCITLVYTRAHLTTDPTSHPK